MIMVYELSEFRRFLIFTLQSPVVISRDHHDVSGTDSPFRETSNITDGSAFTADMAVQNCIGKGFPIFGYMKSLQETLSEALLGQLSIMEVEWDGATSLTEALVYCQMEHRQVLPRLAPFGNDIIQDAERRAEGMLNWDVTNGVARRSWSGNSNAQEAIKRAQKEVVDYFNYPNYLTLITLTRCPD